MKLIIGLGNPGKKYENTRHNVGFRVIDALAKEMGSNTWKSEHQALTAQGMLDGQKVLLVKPQTFMNLSGDAVWALLRYYSDRIEDFLVVYDDLDLSVGALRFRQKGSSGGHNGIKSIIGRLHSEEFDRLKIGIGRPHFNTVDHVLAPFSKEDAPKIEMAIKEAVDACSYWLSHGIIESMNRFNAVK